MTKEEFLKLLPDLARDYQAAPEVMHRIGRVSMLMIIGPSGVGKTSVIKQIDVPYVIADTTREPRQGERNGVDYHFRKDYDNIFHEIQTGQFVQIAVGPTGDFYATRPQVYPESGPAVYAVVADAVPIFRKLDFKTTVSVFITPPSFEEWMRRINTHDLTEQQLKGRLVEARRSLIFALNDGKIHFVLNDDLDKAKDQIKSLLEGNTNDAREQEAKKIATSLLNSLTSE
jgi:guanylate kinase